MPKNQVSDLITDQEIAFADLVLSGTMTDRQAAEAAGLNPDTAAYTKAKPRVRAYMHEHRAAMHDRLVQQKFRGQKFRGQTDLTLWENRVMLSCNGEFAFVKVTGPSVHETLRLSTKLLCPRNSCPRNSCPRNSKAD
jgi:hypothetical protein